MSMTENGESAAIVNAITKLGDSLGLPITAEGIEDEAIAEQLQAIGCHKGQGFHYGRPIPITQVRKLLADRALLPSGRRPVSAEPQAFAKRCRLPLDAAEPQIPAGRPQGPVQFGRRRIGPRQPRHDRPPRRIGKRR